jgi:beta-lactam-binding protein with PASTA domain
MQRIPRDTIIDGRYRVLNRLGSGGMADVYCAEDTELRRQVAIKLLHRNFAEDPEFVERFRREATSAAGLQHPNIVSIFDRGEWDGTPYIAMEYVRGRTLKDIIREYGALEPRLAGSLTLQILAATAFAHRKGIIHRDLKPHNVLVDEEGRAKVADFGIARAGASDMTETGSIMGTAQYLSPEQAQGQPVDERSDLYSIGVVLYELLTGVVPFDHELPVTIALKHVSEAPVPPMQRNPAVPPALDAVALRALRKEPAARYQTADEFAGALRSALAGRMVETAVVDEDAAAVLEEEDERSWRTIAIIALVLLALAAIVVGAYLLTRNETKAVPDVVGKRSSTAAQLLQNEGFEVDVVPIQSDTVPEDRVAGQKPGPGEDAEVGSTVTINVSTGPGEAPVPIVQGLPVDEAVDKLREAGFKSEQRREFSDTVKRDRVIDSSPPEGSSVRRGSTVTLVVSKGKEQAEVPSVEGQPRDQAEQAIRDAGFAPSVTEREDDSKDPGTVLEQDPAGGSKAAKGSTVKLVVAKAPPDVPVPDVVGQPEDDAVQALEDAGFKVRTVDEPADTPDQDGLVTGQDPEADSEQPKGTRITITVGRFEPANPDATASPSPTEAPAP